MLLRGDLASKARVFGSTAFGVSIMMAAGTAAFIPTFKLSNIANVALIYAAAPFIAAILAWAFIREVPSRTFLVARSIAFIGVAIILSGSLGSGHIFSDLLALFMTLMMTSVMVVCISPA